MLSVHIRLKFQNKLSEATRPRNKQLKTKKKPRAQNDKIDKVYSYKDRETQLRDLI